MILQQLSDAFAAAPFDPGGWERALRMLAETTGSARGQLIGLGGPSRVPFNWVNDIDEAALRDFVTIDGDDPGRNFRIAAARGVMQITHERHYAAVQPLLDDDVYNDYCREHDIPHGVQTVLHAYEDGIVGLAVLRTRRDGISTPDQRALFKGAAPFVLNAFRTQLALGNEGEKLLAGALESMTVAACIVDSAASVVAITPAAESLLANDARLRLLANQLRAHDGESQTRLDMALVRALDGGSPDALGAMVAVHDPARIAPPLMVNVSRLGGSPWAFGHLPRALVVLRGHGTTAIPIELLQQAFGLTRGEADIAANIARGMSREQIATARGSSPATVQTQIKAIFAKTGVNREGALAAKIRDLTEL